MKKSKFKKIYWGLILIAVAVFVILKCIGVNVGFIGTLPVVDIILAAIVLSITITAVIDFNIWVIPFGLSVLFMLFETELAVYLGKPDTNLINNWLLLGCALLISIGISLIANPFNHKRFIQYKSVNHDNFKDGKHVKFSSETKYIDCASFENFYYCVRMGDGNIFFENIENYKGGGVLNVECKMGNMVIHVPHDWHIIVNIESGMGNIESDGEGNPEGPQITIDGICKMGNIEIKYC